MGDYSRSAIHTMFNSGTVVGVSANVFGTGFHPKFIPSFTWGETGNTYDLEKALISAQTLHSFKSQTFSNHHKGLLEKLFDITNKFRTV